jgi:AI-2 transport protein TqsA
MPTSERDDALATLLPRALVVLLGTTAASITVAGMRGFSSLLGPVFLALVLTIAVHPFRQRRACPDMPRSVRRSR